MKVSSKQLEMKDGCSKEKAIRYVFAMIDKAKGSILSSCQICGT